MTLDPGAADQAAATEGTPEHRQQIRKAALASTVGTTIEWYDFFLYGTAAGIVFNKLCLSSEDHLVGTLLAFATFAPGFVARPVGGPETGGVGPLTTNDPRREGDRGKVGTPFQHPAER